MEEKKEILDEIVEEKDENKKVVIEMDKDTLLKDLLEKYPYLKKEALKIDERFKIIDSPLGKILLRKATIADLAEKGGLKVDDVIEEIQKIITKYEGE